MTPRVLVAGIGNIFLSDDGFGSEVARRLARRDLGPGVIAIDYGIRGIHLAYDLLDGYEALIIVDTVSRGGMPGDLCVIEVRPGDVGGGEFDAHGMEPVAVLAGIEAMGGQLPRTHVVGCEPASVEEGMGLTPAVAAAIEPAINQVMQLLSSRLSAGRVKERVT